MAAPVGEQDLVLVTGALGRVGSALRGGLRPHVRLRLLDRRHPDHLAAREESVVADIRDLAAVREAALGCAAIVHLAAIPGEAPHDDLLDVNARGTFNVLQAAVGAGCGRFVFASTNHVTGFYPSGARVTPEMPPRPDGLYGASKVYGEALCRLHHDEHGLEVAVIRIGSALAEATAPRHAHTWLSHRDLVELVWRCLVAPSLGWTVVYGSSANRAGYWDDLEARRRLGYAPVDDGGAAVPPGPPDRYQGGPQVGHP
ncbi:MAG: NAD-dependent epimerase/dehydratase family protein [Candidatus Dormibacteraceae bacterium]